eukprot:EG_transcript_20557
MLCCPARRKQQTPEGPGRGVLEDFLRTPAVPGVAGPPDSAAGEGPPLGGTAAAEIAGDPPRHAGGPARLPVHRRMAAGLPAPLRRIESVALPYYWPWYASPAGVLEFCTQQLPFNPLGLTFPEPSMLAMAGAAARKLQALRQRGYSGLPDHAYALFVCTYEIPGHGLSQIFQAMTDAMRAGDPDAIGFWRPLIWWLDTALLSLPPAPGRVYRGYDRPLPLEAYGPGSLLSWPAFSSATTGQQLAEAAYGKAGAILFLDAYTARHVAEFSANPEQREVLFRPHTMAKVSVAFNAKVLHSDFPIPDVTRIALEEVAP